MSDALDFIKWHCYRLGEKLGWLGLLAVVLLLVTLLMYLFLMLPSQQALLAAAPVSELVADGNNKKSHNAARDLETQISAFNDLLPLHTEKTTQIEQIIAIASQQDLKVSAVNYQSKQEKYYSITEMKFSTQSAYPKLKAFISEVLYQLPNVALKALDMQRLKSDQPLVRSDIRLTLYYKVKQ